MEADVAFHLVPILITIRHELHIAFVSGRDGDTEIYVMNAADGTGQARRTVNPEAELAPARNR